MRKKFLAILIFLQFGFIGNARASIFGEETAVLIEILVNAIKKLTELKSIVDNGKDTLSLLQEINRGINDSLRMAETFGLRIDPGLYKDLRQIDEATRAIENLYGAVTDSKLATVQRNTDQTVAEAVSFNNELNEYAKKLDVIGEEIKMYSHQVSPGGAQKLTAQSLGVMIHVLYQQMRAQGQGLKLQAQALAITNKKEKDSTAQYLTEGAALKSKLVGLNPEFKVMRF